MPATSVMQRLETTMAGLSVKQIASRKARFGNNILERGRGEHAATLLWNQINHPINYILILSTLIAILIGKVLDGIVVIGAVALNTIIGFLQESRAGKAIEALMSLVPEETTVIRAGSRRRIPSKDLIPGDVILLQSGDKVPADARIIQCNSFKVEEAALTGESIPADKSPEPVPEVSAVADRICMIYGGTLVRFGTATAVITSIGESTELGRISSMLQQTSQIETPLTQALSKIGKSLTWVILGLAGTLFFIALLRDYSISDAMLASITLAVAAIPEGLPTIITMALAVGVRRMAKRHAIVRKLPAVETLGSTTVVCTDKTGTLTRNQMMVREVWCPDGVMKLEGEGYSPQGEFFINSQKGAPLTDNFRNILICGRLCNDTHLSKQHDAWIVDGDPTEAALLVAADRAGLSQAGLNTEYPRIATLPFESERQLMATLHEHDQTKRTVFVKGAPEVILNRCERFFETSSSAPDTVHAQVERMAARGMRVLALARKSFSRQQDLTEESLHGLEFLGLQGMIDPPRMEALSAVRKCRHAGITVKMITGDHKATARSIARELEILGTGGVVTGTELDGYGEETFLREILRNHVFARVAPEHKLKLVRGLQSQGQVVAMTGDGVNDAPALKQADIGVAMGITGTSVSKEAAKMVLTNDNFATIAASVEEGRRIFDNLVKALTFVLPTNLGMAAILLFSVLFFPVVNGHPLLPILPVQTLWINLVTGATLAFPLAVEAIEPDVMARPPRRKGESLLNRSSLLRMISVAAIMAFGGIGLFLYEYYVELEHHLPEAVALKEAQTMTVTAITLFQIFYLLTCRSFRRAFWATGFLANRAAITGIVATLLLQIGFIYFEPMNRIFSSVPLNRDAWTKSLIVALLIIPIIEGEKAWRRRTN